MPNERSLNLAKAKLRTIARAERRLQHRLADLEWEQNELLPALDSVEKLAAVGQTPAFEMVDGGILTRLKKVPDADSQD